MMRGLGGIGRAQEGDAMGGKRHFFKRLSCRGSNARRPWYEGLTRDEEINSEINSIYLYVSIFFLRRI